MISRPYITLSCAISLDGYLDDASPDRLLLSNAEDFDRVDAVRARQDGILVGATTIRRDNPRLMIRSSDRRAARQARGLPPDPTKITITTSGDLDPQAAFFTAGESARIIYTPTATSALLARQSWPATVIDSGPKVDLGRLLQDLADRGLGRLLVEGGGAVLTEFLSQRLFDELQVAIAPIAVGNQRAPRFIQAAIGSLGSQIQLAEIRKLGDIALLRYVTPTALDHALRRALAPARAVLLDFDGPVTPLLADGRDAVAAKAMRRILAEQGVHPPGELRTTRDPLDLLEWATPNRVGAEIAATVDRACIAGEVAAAHQAPLTVGANCLLAACRTAQLPVIMVSNNSAEAIDAFLDRHDLASMVAGIVARLPGRPDLMKPDPDPVRRALRLLGREPRDCVLIGDSITDMRVSMITGVTPIGYSRDEGRRHGLDLAGAEVIIDRLDAISAALS